PPLQGDRLGQSRRGGRAAGLGRCGRLSQECAAREAEPTRARAGHMTGRRAAPYGLGPSGLAGSPSLGPAPPAAEGPDALLNAFQLMPLGDQKPTPFTLDSLDGKPVSLDTVRGKAVLLYFWESG